MRLMSRYFPNLIVLLGFLATTTAILIAPVHGASDEPELMSSGDLFDGKHERTHAMHRRWREFQADIEEGILWAGQELTDLYW